MKAIKEIADLERSYKDICSSVSKLKENIQKRDFSPILTNEIQKSILSIQFDINYFTKQIDNAKKQQVELKSEYVSKLSFLVGISTLNWAKKLVKNINKQLKKIKKEYEKENFNLRNQRVIEEKILDIEYFLKPIEASVNYLSKQDIAQLYAKKYEQDHSSSAIPASKLKKGDIIISYITNQALKETWEYRVITKVEGSRFAHSAIVYEIKKDKIITLAASGHRKVTTVLPLDEIKGVSFFIFRPNLNKKLRDKYLVQLDAWGSYLKKYPQKFSMKKLSFAIAWGVFYTVGIRLLNSIIVIKNPFRSDRGFFCSELVNMIFLEIGIYLTPRSQYSSTVGPTEIAASSHLEFVGILNPKKQGKDQKNLVNYYSSDKVLQKHKNNTKDGLTNVEKVLFEKFFKPKTSVLDIGCSTGRTTIGLRDHGYKPTGVDITPAMIISAREHAKKNNIKIKYEIADARELPFKKDSFDNIYFSDDGWSEIPKHNFRQQALLEMARVVKPGGILVLSVKIKEATLKNLGFWVKEFFAYPLKKFLTHRNDFVEIGDVFTNKKNTPRYTHYSNTKSISNQLKEAGFDVLLEHDNPKIKDSILLVCWRRKDA